MFALFCNPVIVLCSLTPEEGRGCEWLPGERAGIEKNIFENVVSRNRQRDEFCQRGTKGGDCGRGFMVRSLMNLNQSRLAIASISKIFALHILKYLLLVTLLFLVPTPPELVALSACGGVHSLFFQCNFWVFVPGGVFRISLLLVN